jgi:hypothetical protein
MDRTAFEAALQHDGFEVVARTMEPNTTNPEHAHEFDARVLVVAGEMTLARDGTSRAYRPGETFEITMAQPGRARPQPTPETQHFWDGTKRAGEIRLQRCDACAQGLLPAAAVLPGVRRRAR